MDSKSEKLNPPKKSFIKEYEKLCDKYKMFINVCDLCNGPWVERICEYNLTEYDKILKDLYDSTKEI